MSRRVLPLALLVLLIPAAASAGDLPSRNALRLDAGLFSAVGELGTSYTRSLTSLLQLEAGVGVGLSGVQLSLMPKLSAGQGRHRYVGGIGVSAAIFLGAGPDDSPAFAWLNADVLGYEYRSSGGFTLLAAVGLTVGLAGHYSWEESQESIRGTLMPQARLGVGYCF